MILALLLLALVVFVVGGPVRAARERAAAADGDDARPLLGNEHAADEPASDAWSAELDELETAREAKYREIRDAELDYRTGKLSSADYAAIDADLRAEAIEILDSIERAQARVPEGRGAADDREADCEEGLTGGRERAHGGAEGVRPRVA